MNISRKLIATVKRPKRSSLVMSSSVLVAAVVLASCASNRAVVMTEPLRAPEVPAAAKFAGGGVLGFAYKAPADGTLFIVDGNTGRLLASNSMTAGQEFELDTTRPDMLQAIRESNRASNPAAARASSSTAGDKPTAAQDEYHPRIVLYFLPN